MTRSQSNALRVAIPSFSCMASRPILAACLALLTTVAHGQVTLTFDDDGTVANGEPINQDYGDRVTASPDGNGLLYNVVGPGAPNVVAAYGPLPNDPSLWSTGYGDLTNVYYNEIESGGLLQITLTADPGFEVGLLGFEVASFGGDLLLQDIEIVNGRGGVLLSLGENTIFAGSQHTDFDFTDGLFAGEINLNVDLTGLGGASDNIGLDNVRFTQRAIPEPGAAFLLSALTTVFAAITRR